ncbi:MAG: hypothetical protein K5754_02825 [Butyrivibrio sp.]|jgi:hypothetical protein|nr:hypothetical protein [Butyrivibrio sp.]MCR4635139.1 hypothetical protein [Butyrivibrio sp.]
MKILKKALKAVIDNILFFTVIAGIVFYFSSLILNDFGLQYRFGIKKIVIILLVVFAFSGMIQVIYHLNSMRSRILLTVAMIVTIIGTIPFFLIWGSAYIDTIEELVVRNDKTMVARDVSEFFGGLSVTYYEYYNGIICGKNAVYEERHNIGNPFNPKEYYLLACKSEEGNLENENRYTWHDFFTIFSDKYEYQVQEFLDEKVKTVDVNLTLLAVYDECSVYSMDISYDDVSERYLNGSIDRYNIGKFMICEDSIYLLYDHQSDMVPSKDDFLEKGIRFEGREDRERNIDGIIVTYNYSGEWTITDTRQQMDYHLEYGWSYHEGLTYFRSWYGDDNEVIEITRKAK